MALSCYAIGLAGYSAIKVLTPAFYALKDSRTPMLVSLASIAINAGMAYGLVRVANLGHAGLALATSSVAMFSFLVLFWLMKRRIGGVHGRRLRAVIVKVAAGSFLMAIAVLIVHWLVGLVATSRTMQYFGDLVLTIPAGIATVWISCRWMKVEELEMATRALGGPIARRFSRRA